VARERQREIIDEVKAHYDEHGHTVVYLHGKPGTGKSLLGLLLTKELNGSLCNTFDPTEPGDTLNGLYNRVAPEKESPLIVVMDEFDVVLHNIHVGVAPHKNIPIQVKNKTTWNQFLDRIQIGMYPNLILVLTSNKTPDYINEMDPSYIRKGRVDLCCEV
jgi:Cdc6-like AAA superfamily ATPase